MARQQGSTKQENKSCSNCKVRGICYKFYEMYYPSASKLRDNFERDKKIEKALDKIKEAIAQKCNCWELYKE